MAIFLGLDGGGSKLQALAVDEAGRIVHEAEAGRANAASTPEAEFRQHVRQVNPGQVDVVSGCFAGVLTAADRERVAGWLAAEWPGAVIAVRPDYHATWLACPEGTDVCVIAGTGSLVVSGHGEEIVKSGGGGPLLADAGSGFAIGRSWLARHLLTLRDERTPEVKSAMAEVFGTEDRQEILAKIYAPGGGAGVVARFAGVAVREALDGDDDTDLDSLLDLGVQVLNHVRETGWKRPDLNVAVAGGIWEADSRLLPWFGACLEQAARVGYQDGFSEPTILLQKLERPPVWGAVRLAQTLRP